MIRTKISAANSGVPEDHVSVHSKISQSYIRGRFVLPVGTDPAPVMEGIRTLGPTIESSITGDSMIATAITMPGSTLSLSKYDVWIWGNHTAEAENDVSEATSAFSWRRYIWGVTAISVCSRLAV